MIKLKRKYTDFNGVEREEDFYFGLTKAELIEMELGTVGTFTQSLDAIIKAKNMPALIREFKALVRKSYGEKSADGKRFIKSEELSDAFCQTSAYSDIFMELVTDDEKASKFINGILPSDLQDQLDKAKKDGTLPALSDGGPEMTIIQ